MRRNLPRPLWIALTLALALLSCARDGELGPAETVEQVAQGLAAGESAVLWEALPASYQRDVNGLVHEFAEAVDPELWNRTFEVLAKLTRVLKEKREFIVGHPMVAPHLDDVADEDVASWNALVEALDVLVTSEVADVEQLARLDIGNYLETTGRRFAELTAEASDTLQASEQAAELEANLAKLRELEVSVVSESGASATVRIEVPGEEPETVELSRVEGKWVPADLAEAWSESIDELRGKIAALSEEEIAQNKGAILMQLGMVDSVLDALLGAKTEEEFNSGIGAVVGMAMGAALSGAAQADAGAAAPGAGLFGGALPGAGPKPPLGSAPPVPVLPDLGQAPGSVPAALDDSAPLPAAIRRAPRETGPSVSLDDAASYLGRELQVSAAGGLDKRARLVRVEGDVLFFEQRFGSGSLGFELRRSEIRSLSEVR